MQKFTAKVGKDKNTLYALCYPEKNDPSGYWHWNKQKNDEVENHFQVQKNRFFLSYFF